MGLIGVLLLILAIPTDDSAPTDSGAEDVSISENSSVSASDNNIYASELESRLINILSHIDGVGEVSVMITAEADDSQITGIVVVAEGGGDPNVAVLISEAVMTLFKVEAHRIKVIKMSSGG
jgi:stage III sporulation protein AG